MSSSRVQPPVTWKKTTTNINRNGSDEESAHSAKGTNQNAAVNASTIRTRSPRKMKTQIARLVYDPSTKSNRNDEVNENETPAVEEFEIKRQERDKEVTQIKEMLNEITKTPTKEKPNETSTAKNLQTKQIHSFQRSKTETNIQRPTARRNQLKTQSQTARSKSVQPKEKESSPIKPRQKNYNSEEAQRYMQEQKKKRKTMPCPFLLADAKPAVDKDQIKKRLEDLRKNTRKIVDKNVKIAKKKAGVCPGDVKIERKQEQITKKVVRKMEIPEKVEKVQAWVEIPSNKPIPSEKPHDPSPLSDNCKKIGLLRKSEIKDHSFSAIKDFNMDKENVVIEMLTPQIRDYHTSLLKDMKEPKESEILKEQFEIARNSEPLKTESYISNYKRRSVPELDLKVPDAKLKTRVSLLEKSVQVDTSNKPNSKPLQKNTELPYWLKPTSVQAYPYNFIMAVRKKLEAIANPPAIASSSSSLDYQSDKTVEETPLSYPKTNRSNNVKRRIIEKEQKSLVKSLEKPNSNKENLMEHGMSRTLSEVTSNFSSISIQMPVSNTVNTPKSKSHKQISEIKKPLHFDEDDTTVSSSILSSPEKKMIFNNKLNNLQPTEEQLSPLSIENISNLHIKSQKPLISNITLNRGDTFSSQNKVESSALSTHSEGSVNFSQLLEDFNRSLSQVIEVNDQLKTTLEKSHQIFSPEKNKKSQLTTNPAELTEYVSDFEESSNVEEDQTNKTLTNSSIPELHSASQNINNANSEQSSSPSSSTEQEPEEEIATQSSSDDKKSKEGSPSSLGTQTFIVSSGEAGIDSSKTRTIHEEAIEESPSKDNLSGNQFSIDSLETSTREDYIKSHINTSRGDYRAEEQSEKSAGPPSYKATTESHLHEPVIFSPLNLNNSSVDSEFVRVFNKSDMEISVLSLNRSLSESTLNYSSIGLYEKLIQNETCKSDHLSALLKMREKALIDRTKGQIALLEVQKERYKAKGLTVQISNIKKKQRGILMKMEKEREEIKKLLQQAKVGRNNKLQIPEIRPSSDVTLLQHCKSGIQTSAASQAANIYHQQQQNNKSKPPAIVRGYELETSRSLEQLLQKREEDLRRRREHVERLMEWHRRLDQEEAEVLQLERILLDYNNVHVPQAQGVVQVEERHPNQNKMEKKLKEIDRSLRELSSISGAEGSADGGASDGDFVRTTGSKLNKLWRRLTSQRTEKFQPNKKYKLGKHDLEQLYEDAKLAVLHDFGENADQMEAFIAQTSLSTPQQSILGEVPQLNLNFSSGQSEEDIIRGNYSPCTAEGEFMGLSDGSNKDGASVSKRKPTSRSSSLPDSDQSSSSSRKNCKNLRLSDDNKTNVASTEMSFKFTKILEHSKAAKNTISVGEQKEHKTNEKTEAESAQQPSAGNSSTEVTISPKSGSNQYSSIESVKTDSLTTPENLQSKQIDDAESNAENKSSLSSNSSANRNCYKNSKTDGNSTSSVKNATPLNSKQNSNSEMEIGFSGSAFTPENVSSSNKTTVSSIHSETEIGMPSSSLAPENVSSCNKTVSSINSNKNHTSDNILSAEILSNQSLSEEPVISTELEENQQQTTSYSKINSLESATDIPKANDESRVESVPLGNISEIAHESREESPTVSILTSLLNSSKVKNATSNSEVNAKHNSFSSDFEKEVHQKTNGFKEQKAAKNSNKANPTPLSKSDSIEESTLKSIKSIDNSTNSKHSIDPATHFSTASNSPTTESLSSINSTNLKSESTQIPEDVAQIYSSSFEDPITTNQSRSSVIMSTKTPTPPPAIEDPESFTNVFYESDFTEGEETNIDDLSLPKFETTGEEDHLNESQLNTSPTSLVPSNRTDFEKRLNDLDMGLKDLNITFEKALSPDKGLSPPRDDGVKKVQQQYSKEEGDDPLMPDIISEVELRRRQQAILENEYKQLEHAVPYMYVREIPNKPPPPYVPPAHGSPMTTIFPSEERIKDITYRRTKELYYEILNIDTKDENGKKPPSVLDENITNIYERIILDICKEYLTEYKPVLTSADPNNFHSQLAFFNPPDRLKCMQDFIYKEVRKSLEMDKNSPKRNQVYSVYDQRVKRDHIEEIIIKEIFEEDDKWSNFYEEEEEVLDLIIEEIIGGIVREIATDVLEKDQPNNPSA